MEEVKVFKHLRQESYYNDLYDKFTVEECRRFEKYELSEEKKGLKKKDKKDKIKKELIVKVISPTALYFIKGERYIEKAERIKEWIEKDRALDERVENTIVPKNILCPSCRSEMILWMKDLQNDYRDRIEKVLFFFNCPNCNKKRLIFENGKDWECPLTLCKKCGSVMDSKNKKKGRKITTIYTCPNCDYEEEDILDLDEKPKPEEIDLNFEKDRKRFCLSDEEGRKYISHKEKLKHISEMIGEFGKKAEIEKKVSKIKKLNIAQLKKILTKPLEKEDYINLEFSKPEIGREIVINFTIQDNKEDRGEYDSRIELQRIIKKKLEGTNWKLMSEGVYYRLGILSGRLRAYDNEEDLLKLIENN